MLEEGDSISADARVVRQYELSTNNIALTGESDAVRKTADPILEEELAVINMPNLVFMGTSVASGTGRAVVFNTGLKTEFGRIFSLTAGVADEKSPLSARDRPHGADRLRASPSACGVLLFVLALLIFNFGAVSALLFALGVMVALVPEGLPATLSVALAIGVQRMAKVQALIKKLVRRRDAGLHQRDLHRQDRHAHQGRDDGQGDVRRRPGVRGDRRRLRTRRRVRCRRRRAGRRTRRGAASSA